jgi:hypothetical protein
MMEIKLYNGGHNRDDELVLTIEERGSFPKGRRELVDKPCGVDSFNEPNVNSP